MQVQNHLKMEDVFNEIFENKGLEVKTIKTMSDEEVKHLFYFFNQEYEYHVKYSFRCHLIVGIECIGELKRIKKILRTLKNEIHYRELDINPDLEYC